MNSKQRRLAYRKANKILLALRARQDLTFDNEKIVHVEHVRCTGAAAFRCGLILNSGHSDYREYWRRVSDITYKVANGRKLLNMRGVGRKRFFTMPANRW